MIGTVTLVWRGIGAACLAVMLASLAAAQTTSPRDPKLAPEPAFFMKNNTLGFGVPVPTFRSPEEAKGYIESTHASWPWTLTVNGTVTNGPLYCSASAAQFIKGDFPALSSPSYWSSETPFRAISRNRGQCLQWSGNVCTSFQCVPDSWAFQYNMRADCPVNMVYAVPSGQPRCECPGGQELERNAAGEWRCAAPQVANVANPACYRQDGSCPAGNPVMPGIAAKVQTEVDYEGAGAHALSFTRSFRSHGARPYVEPGAWSHWVHNWARRIEVYPELGYKGRAFVIREDASQRIYGSDGGGTWATQQVGDRNVLTEQRDAYGARTGFQYKLWADDSVEHYDPAGRLMRVVQRNGWTSTLTYSDATTQASIAPRSGLLISVRNHFGRELRFTYDIEGRLTELLPPGAVSGTAPGNAASPIRYLHNESTGLGAGVPALNQLTSVVWQDGAVRRYHYENTQFPQWLTGRTDELGVRIGTYTYNTSGQLERSAGPSGMNTVEFVYSGTTTQITDRSGATAVTSVYTWESAAGVIRPTAVSAACPQCGSTSARTAYTASGEVARRVDHDGRITFYAYDAKGRETERATFSASHNGATTRPALNLAEQVVSTKWHSTWNLPTQVAEPARVTTYTYGIGGRLTGESWTATTDAIGAAKFSAVKTGSTHATGWGFNSGNLSTSIVEKTGGVETGRWTMAYDALGNVTRTTHVGSGAVSTVTAYDARGRMLTGLNDSGATVSFQYSPRGFVTGRTIGAESTAFVQSAIGLTTEVRMPDSQSLAYVYDATHELIDVRLNGASITPAMLAVSDYPDSPNRALIARAKALVERGIGALISPAYAQSVGQARRRIVPIPGGAMPGQPEFDPRTEMMSVRPTAPLDRVAVRLAEKFARMCECKPDGGYDRPTFTFVTFAHVLFSGHLSQRFSDKSYFAPTEKVGQALVDEVISQGREVSEPSDSRVVFEADLVRAVKPVGYSRSGTGVFVPTNKVRVVYERSHCDTQFRARNEVVTVYPI